MLYLVFVVNILKMFFLDLLHRCLKKIKKNYNDLRFHAEIAVFFINEDQKEKLKKSVIR